MPEMDDKVYAEALATELESLTVDLKKTYQEREQGRQTLQSLQQEHLYLQKQKEQRTQLFNLYREMTVLQKQLQAKEIIKQQALQDLSVAQRNLQRLEQEAGLSSMSSDASWNDELEREEPGARGKEEKPVEEK